MEAQTALIWTDGAVELYTIAKVYVYLALIIDPWHAERNDTLRLNDTLDDFCFFKLWMLVVDVFNRGQHLAYCL